MQEGLKDMKVNKNKEFFNLNEKQKNSLKKSNKVFLDLRPKFMIAILNEMVPKNVKSALDIGSGCRISKAQYIKHSFKKYIGLDTENADINQDLNINQKIDLPNNSVEIVIVSNILEHLINPMPIVSECKRIAKKYILIGLPNEYPLDKRIQILFGNWEDWVYLYGHKHMFSIESIERLIQQNFGGYERKKLCFQCRGGRFIPKKIKNFLVQKFPGLFAGEVFYLIKKHN